MVPQPTAREPQHIVVNGHRLDAPEPQAVLSVPGAWARGWFTVRRHKNDYESLRAKDNFSQV